MQKTKPTKKHKKAKIELPQKPTLYRITLHLHLLTPLKLEGLRGLHFCPWS